MIDALFPPARASRITNYLGWTMRLRAPKRPWSGVPSERRVSARAGGCDQFRAGGVGSWETWLAAKRLATL